MVSFFRKRHKALAVFALAAKYFLKSNKLNLSAHFFVPPKMNGSVDFQIGLGKFVLRL